MYVHIGNGAMVKDSEIIGVFDIERATVSQDTREYLRTAAPRKRDVSCTEEIPRSFVVTFDREILDERVYVSRVSPRTIAGRVKGKLEL